MPENAKFQFYNHKKPEQFFSYFILIFQIIEDIEGVVVIIEQYANFSHRHLLPS